MFIRMTCHACGVRFKVNVKNAGKQGRCPEKDCSKKFMVPVPKEADLENFQSRKLVSAPFGQAERRTISEAELDKLADAVALKLGWDQEDSVHQSEFSSTEFTQKDFSQLEISQPELTRVDPGNDRLEGSFSYLQPCGVMPLEAIYFLRKQRKLGIIPQKELFETTQAENTQAATKQVEKKQEEVLLAQAVDDQGAIDKESSAVAQTLLLRKRARRTYLRRAVVILAGTFVLSSIAAGFIFFRNQDSSNGPLMAKGSEKESSETGNQKKAEVFPDVPPPPVVMEASLEVPPEEEAEDPNAVAVVLVSSDEASSGQAVSSENQGQNGVSLAYQRDVYPVVKKYCVECHSGSEAEGGIDFGQLMNFPKSQKERKAWQKILSMLEAKAMPPEDHEPKPSDQELDDVADWIADNYFNINCDEVNDPGRVTIRRLNRQEYSNTIRDLVGIKLNLSKDFPSDEVGEGFDNIGDVLSLPPLLMEKYLQASQKIVDAAIIADPKDLIGSRKYQSKDLSTSFSNKAKGLDFIPLVSNDNVYIEVPFQWDGTYLIRVEAAGDQAGPDKVRMGIRIDGKQVDEHTIKEHKSWKVFESKIVIGKSKSLKKGKHRISAAFLNDYYNPKAKKAKDRDRNMGVRFIEIEGPLEGADVSYPESHRRIIFVEPGKENSAHKCFQQIFLKFTELAYRRPVSRKEINPILKLVEKSYEEGESFEESVKLGLQAILISPHFLFRIELDEKPDDPKASHDLSEYELASRLSYFLWSSMPDEELFQLAREKKLHQPEILKKQVLRMLSDSRSIALVKNFGSQWLNLRSLDNAAPDFRKYPEFNDQLKRAMWKETELLFTEIMKKDRSILEFLTADYTFLNERLAKHYGIKGVEGKKFRRVELKQGQRKGVLTHASILTLTSAPKRTIPVKRGKWIMENILGVSPPPPPPGVPELAEAQKKNPKLSIREQMAIHRANPTCASCHVLMDPIGLGFENYDPIGRWREKDNELSIDASGELPGGQKFGNALELVSLLEKNKKQFGSHLSRQLLTYALGRGLLYYDDCAIEEVVLELENQDYRFSVLVSEIVLSHPFTRRRGDGGQE
jgi:Protein of unknown function (DUF1592)/Protein of unknown function (DUF1588)/Protein of unknown function (DUF1587)/Protein of unknown function (DUF1585)/Protein of unknown function (DUF1595)/Ca-dependent carbohydrate-binding module xylan-binding/Planctomycete cytochrome C